MSIVICIVQSILFIHISSLTSIHIFLHLHTHIHRYRGPPLITPIQILHQISFTPRTIYKFREYVSTATKIYHILHTTYLHFTYTLFTKLNHTYTYLHIYYIILFLCILYYIKLHLYLLMLYYYRILWAMDI